MKYGNLESETPTSQSVDTSSSAQAPANPLQKAGSWIATKLQEQSPSSIGQPLAPPLADLLGSYTIFAVQHELLRLPYLLSIVDLLSFLLLPPPRFVSSLKIVLDMSGARFCFS